jgi:hypothetical protein
MDGADADVPRNTNSNKGDPFLKLFEGLVPFGHKKCVLPDRNTHQAIHFVSVGEGQAA